MQGREATREQKQAKKEKKKRSEAQPISIQVIPADHRLVSESKAKWHWFGKISHWTERAKVIALKCE